MTAVPDNVYAIDCDEVNNTYDRPKGHSYFLNLPGQKNTPGLVFEHLAHTLKTGRVDLDDAVARRKVI